MDEGFKPLTPDSSSASTIAPAQADFDALLLEAVIKSQYRVVEAAINAGAFIVLLESTFSS